MISHHHTSTDLARSNTLRSSGSDNSSQNGLTTIYAVGNASGHVNGTQTLMATPAISSRKSGSGKSGGTASTIRKIFGSSSQRKVMHFFIFSFNHLSMFYFHSNVFSPNRTEMVMRTPLMRHTEVYPLHND